MYEQSVVEIITVASCVSFERVEDVRRYGVAFDIARLSFAGIWRVTSNGFLKRYDGIHDDVGMEPLRFEIDLDEMGVIASLIEFRCMLHEMKGQLHERPIAAWFCQIIGGRGWPSVKWQKQWRLPLHALDWQEKIDLRIDGSGRFYLCERSSYGNALIDIPTAFFGEGHPGLRI